MKILRSIQCLLMALLCSCAAQKLPRPSVTMINAEIGDVSLFETGAKFTLRFDNPATVDFVANGATHEIVVNGVAVGSALDNSRIVIPRLGSLKREVAIHSQDVELLTRLRAMMEKSKIDYKIDSRLYTEGGMFGKGEIALHHEASLNLDNLGQAPKTRPTGRRFDPDEFRLIDPDEQTPTGEDPQAPPQDQQPVPGF